MGPRGVSSGRRLGEVGRAERLEGAEQLVDRLVGGSTITGIRAPARCQRSSPAGLPRTAVHGPLVQQHRGAGSKRPFAGRTPATTKSASRPSRARRSVFR
jgi:hypothetical protein